MAVSFDRFGKGKVRIRTRDFLSRLHRQEVREYEKRLKERVRYTEISDVVEYEYRSEEVDGRLREGPCFVRFFPRVSGSIKIYYKSRAGKIGGVKDVIRVNERNRQRIYDKFKGLRADQFVITVGVLEENETHNGVTPDSSMSYKDLFEILKELGYDPLFSIRQKKYVDAIEKEIGDIFLKSINKKKPDDTRTIKSRMSSVARKIVDDAIDYIIGGKKPPLQEPTVYQRHWKQSNYGITYPNGIDEPLSESGQIENAIGFKISAFRSSDRIEYWKEKKAQKKAIKKEKQPQKSEDEFDDYEYIRSQMGEIQEKLDSILNTYDRLRSGKIVAQEHIAGAYNSIRESKRLGDRMIRSLMSFINGRGKNLDENYKSSVLENLEEIRGDFK